jgi:hypothetical protein
VSARKLLQELRRVRIQHAEIKVSHVLVQALWVIHCKVTPHSDFLNLMSTTLYLHVPDGAAASFHSLIQRSVHPATHTGDEASVTSKS